MSATWTVSELAYLAGIIDGEGCLSLSTGKSSKRTRHGTQIFVGNTDGRLVWWLHQRFGGSIGVRQPKKPTHKPLWRWLVSGAATESVLSAVLPYLVIKREQAELLLAYRQTVRPMGSNTHTDANVINRRTELKSRLLTLNRRGVI